MLDTVFGHAQNKEERLEWQEPLNTLSLQFSLKKKKKQLNQKSTLKTDVTC